MLLRDQITVVDFETQAIASRPAYPPKPVGVAVQRGARAAQYYGWGHPSQNNSTQQQAQNAVAAAYASKSPIIFHHAKFDLDVARKHFGLPLPPTSQWEDTMLLAYLHDPHSPSLALKDLCPRYLGTDPKERDELRAWILANIPKAKASDWGAYIAQAPGGLVGSYAAAGDASMTGELYRYLVRELTEKHGERWREGYNREKELVPVLLENEAQGVRIDVDLLANDTKRYEQILLNLEQWIRDALGVGVDCNLESGAQIAGALEAAGKASGFKLTPKGNRSTSKDSLSKAISDPILALALDYRGTLATYLQTFMRKWLEINTGGRIYTSWNATRQAESGGTRTGRLSSHPNFQNIPSDEKREAQEKGYAPLHAALPWLPPLPQMKVYIVADAKNHVLCGRDWSQQEPRVLAHMSDGALLQSYKKNPKQDVYLMMMVVLKSATGMEITRKQMKILVLAIIYGLGRGHLAEKLGCTVDEAVSLQNVFFRTFPEIKDLQKHMKYLSACGKAFFTWGGRPYYCEPPKVIDGRQREFSYKMINYLIQGSSADMAKEAMIRYNSVRKHGRLVLSVHDEILIDAPKECWKEEMEILREIMEGLPLDVKLTSDGYYGYRWGKAKGCS
jgi:DNA polymerase-1